MNRWIRFAIRWWGRPSQRVGSIAGRPEQRSSWWWPRTRLALAVASLYVGAMIAGTSIGRTVALATLGAIDPERLMVTAVPVDPFRRQLVVEDTGRYRVGTVDLLRRVVRVDSVVARGPRFAEAAGALERTAAGRALVRWSRFPVVGALEGGGLWFFDLRYSDGTGPSWASLDVSPNGVVAVSRGFR